MLGGATLVLVGAGLAVYLVVTRSIEDQFDANLTNRVQGFASILFQVKDEVEFEFSDQIMPEYELVESPAYFELCFKDGSPLERSNSLQDGHLVVVGTPSFEATHWTAPLPDGRQGQFVSRLIEVHHVYPEEGPDRPTAATVLIVVARGREELVAAQGKVLIQCCTVALILIGLIAVICWIAVTKGLEPTNRLAATLDAIQVDQLPDRLEIGELPAELEPVADKIDALIGRLDAALKRERRTTADIAHELRTPISELLTVSEVALRDGRDPGASRRALSTVRDVAWRMGRSVSTLLKLARLEMGAETFDRESVDLGGIVRELLRSLSAVERERGLRVENHIEVGDSVEGDSDVLRLVVSNLLSNALYYSPPRGIVECRLDRSDAGWRLLVENDAVELQPEDLLSMSEPFWRKDRESTDRDRSGLGLGLSRALAEKAGLELHFELDGGRFRAILTSPGGGGHREPSEMESQDTAPPATRAAG